MDKNEKINQRNNDNSNSYDREIKDKIVESCLLQAKFDGLTEESLKNACEEHNMDFANGIALFPNIEKDILNHWILILDEKTLAYGNELKNDMRIRDKIGTLVKKRISDLNEHKIIAKKMIAKYILPNSATTFAHQLWDSADKMWIAIGDTTPTNDSNHYSKRLILSTVLGMSISYWANDDDGEINEYIDRRIDDALKLGQLKNMERLKNFTNFLPNMNHPLKMRD